MPGSKEIIELKNKPLIEAIFEIRWELKEGPNKDTKRDPNYKLLIGRIYDKIYNEYPYHEQLETSNIPDEIAFYMIQHRFRVKKNEWPLIQLGPGIITVNDTNNYNWFDFEKRIKKIINILYNLYPNPEKNLKINSILLRYIDAVNFDFKKDDVFEYLRKKMKTDIKLNNHFFDNADVKKIPYGLDLRFNFPSTKPIGAIQFRVVRGKKDINDQLGWETNVVSIDKDAPNNKEDIYKWLLEAHDLAHDWFFKLIEGDLRRQFE